MKKPRDIITEQNSTLYIIIKFYKTALKNTKAYLGGKLYVTFFNYKEYLRYQDICENQSAFSFLEGIEGNEIRVKILEKTKDTFSISFRSNKYVNVCDIARVFNGGGHIRAAGAEVMLPYKELLQQIIEVSKKVL